MKPPITRRFPVSGFWFQVGRKFTPSAFRHPLSAFAECGMRFAVCAVFMLLTSAPFLRADSARSVVAQGNALYDKGKYDDALQKYTRAQALLPNNPLLAYNVGDVLFKQKDYDKALESYRKASTASDKNLAQASFFNMGNCGFAKEDYVNAIEMYKQALNLNPDDAGAKFNLELARKKLKEQSKPQEQQQQNQQQQQSQQQQKQQQQQDQKDQEDQQQVQKKQAMEKKETSEEEARRILDALKNKEKEEQKKQMQKIPGQAGRSGQDW